MSDEAGEKTEKPTGKRLEEALNKGQIARSPEVQTVFVLGGALMALGMTGGEMWRTWANRAFPLWAICTIRRHDQRHARLRHHGRAGARPLRLAGHGRHRSRAACWRAASRRAFALPPRRWTINWERLNPVEGFKRLFPCVPPWPPALGIVKLSVIIALCYNVIKKILSDPIFIPRSMWQGLPRSWQILPSKSSLQVGVALIVLAAADYGYKFWQTNRTSK
jgi:flagellar biosynthetic protein FlhB